MTLVVCFKADGAIVLGADSRGTIGDPRGLTAINDKQDKVRAIGKCGIGLAGASEIGAALLDELGKNGIDKVENIDDALSIVGPRSAQLFGQWFKGIPPDQRPSVFLTLAGYRFVHDRRPEPMIYGLFAQHNFAPQLFINGPCMSGVPQYAVYLVHKYYDPCITINKAKAFAHFLISETASQDPKVGGPIKIAVITSEDGYNELNESEVEGISMSNNEMSMKMRDFFLKGD